MREERHQLESASGAGGDPMNDSLIATKEDCLTPERYVSFVVRFYSWEEVDMFQFYVGDIFRISDYDITQRTN